LNTLYQILLIYAALINIVAIFITVKDKRAAKKRHWRIPEATLLTVGALGGAVIMFLTMLIIRHKTRHLKFMIGLPLIIAAQAALVWWIIQSIA
jgi:uncharacterized membrane protein YsdA (DUF1294 family)